MSRRRLVLHIEALVLDQAFAAERGVIGDALQQALAQALAAGDAAAAAPARSLALQMIAPQTLQLPAAGARAALVPQLAQSIAGGLQAAFGAQPAP